MKQEGAGSLLFESHQEGRLPPESRQSAHSPQYVVDLSLTIHLTKPKYAKGKSSS